MQDGQGPDPTAVRVALWRALHLHVDPPPHVIEDDIGHLLADPGADWLSHPDMNPVARARVRASMVARARYVEDLALEHAGRGISQYVILGAGLDSFAQRRPDANLTVFEIDRPGPQAWKRRRLTELGFGLPDSLRLVPVDFEAGASWRAGLEDAGFRPDEPAVMAATGLTMYLTRQAVAALLRDAAALAPGSFLAMTFQLPTELLEAAEQPARVKTLDAALAMGSPFISFFTPAEIMAMALDAGFRDVGCLSAAEMTDRYFDGRPDGLRPSSAEHMLVAVV
ncbi:MAG: class I SAM-dependent methyltransferase [Sphingomonadales bacterium]